MISVNLTVSNSNESRVHNAPVQTGVPFSYDAGITDVSGLTLLDDGGTEVAADFIPMAHWSRERFIKWVNIRFLADIPKNSTKNYVLKQKQATDIFNNEYQQIAVMDGNNIIVDTGSISFVLNGKKISAVNNQKRTVINEIKPELTLLDGSKPALSKTHELKIEENGATYCSVKWSGVFENGGAGYVIRIEAFRNSPIINISSTIFSLNEKLQINGFEMKVYTTSIKKVTLVDSGESSNFTPIFESKDSFSAIADDFDSINIGNKNIGIRFGGFAKVENNDGTEFSVAVKYFWQKFPKAFEMNARGNALNIGLLPNNSRAKDSFGPLGQIYGCFELKQGESRTHEMMFLLHHDTMQNDEIGAYVNLFNKPLLALAPWNYYTQTKSLGILSVADKQNFEVFENAIGESLKTFLKRREELKAYGDRNFGDDILNGKDFWNNCEYDYTHVGMLMFLRGSGRDWYDLFAEPAAKHTADIDICCYGGDAGKIYPHCVRHNSTNAKLGSHSWIRGLLEYSVFSGNKRVFDITRQVGEVWADTTIASGASETTERGITWPAISMMSLYGHIPDKKYLQAAEILMRKFLSCITDDGSYTGSIVRRDSNSPKQWFTFLLGSPVLESLSMYHMLTDDEVVKEEVKNKIIALAENIAKYNWLDDIGTWEYTMSRIPEGERRHNTKNDRMVSAGVLYAYILSKNEDFYNKSLAAFKYSIDGQPADGKDLAQSLGFGIRIPAFLQYHKATSIYSEKRVR